MLSTIFLAQGASNWPSVATAKHVATRAHNLLRTHYTTTGFTQSSSLLYMKGGLRQNNETIRAYSFRGMRTWVQSRHVAAPNKISYSSYKAAAAVGVATAVHLVNTLSNPAHCERGSLFKRLTDTPIRLQTMKKSEFAPWYNTHISEDVVIPADESVVEAETPFWFFMELLGPQWLTLVLAVLTAVGSAYVNIQIPMALGGLVNAVNEGVFDESVLWDSGVKLVELYIAQSTLTAIYIALLAKVGEEMACSARVSLFGAILRQDMEFFDRRQTGEVVGRLTNDVQEYKSAFKQVVSQGLRASTQFCGSIISMWLASSKLCTLTLVIVPLMVAIGSSMGTALRALSAKASQQVGVATSVAQESVGNIRTVRAFATEDQEKRLFSQECGKAAYINQYLGLGIGIFQGMSNFGINTMALMVLYYGGKMCGQGEITGGELMAFLVSTQQTQRSMSSLSVLFGAVVRGGQAGTRIFEYVKNPSHIPLVGGIRLGDVQGNIEFRGVDFVYPTRPNHQVLSDVSIHAPAGKVLALCGPSGSGKSTIGSLLERFYDPATGQIFIDGVDIKSLDPKWLRGSLIGYIGQEPILFYTSIKENIRYGRPDATDAEIEEAARKANAHEFISEFPGGYDTVVGERGASLSGGQRQRVSIARALLKDPKILILDEATSALDTESERLVQDALNKLLHGRTVIVIAHRLSTIKDADCIAVLKHGRVRETGTHDELLTAQGIYADLVRRQVSPDVEIF